MKIKNYKCKCGCDDFAFVDVSSTLGIYCTYCGRWLKWANKNEKNILKIEREKNKHDSNN